MFYFVGDLHGHSEIYKLKREFFKGFRIPYFKKGDILFILGDFGIPFLDEGLMQGKDMWTEYLLDLEFLSKLPCKVLFIDGNHDNHNFWDSLPVVEMYGGRVHIHPRCENIVHLMRGEVYEIKGKKFFTFGGASSIDKEYRVENISWWTRENATEEEFQHAIDNLKKHDYTVDYVLSHTMPMSLVRLNGYRPIPDITANYLDFFYNDDHGHQVINGVDVGVNFKRWYCGHFHIDREVGKNIKCLYTSVEWKNETTLNE